MLVRGTYIPNCNTERLCIVESTLLCVPVSVEFLLAEKRNANNTMNFMKTDTGCIEVVCILLVLGSKALNVEFSSDNSAALVI